MVNPLAYNSLEQVEKQVVNNSIDADLVVLKSPFINNKLRPKELELCPFKVFFPAIIVSPTDVSLDFIVTTFARLDRSMEFCVKNLYQLTKQEGLIVEAIANGLCTKKIARVMNLSAHTVSGYMKAIYIKFGAKSRSEVQFILSIIKTDTKLELCKMKNQKCSIKHSALPLHKSLSE